MSRKGRASSMMVKAGVSPAEWIKINFDRVDRAVEERRIELVKLFESNAQWLADLAAKKEKQTVVPATPQTAVKRKGRSRNTEILTIESVKKVPVSVKKPKVPSSVLKKSKEPASVKKPPGSVKKAPASVRKPPMTRNQKKARLSGRPSDAFKIEPTDSGLDVKLQVAENQPSTPAAKIIQGEEQEIQSGNFSLKKPISVVIPSTKQRADERDSVAKPESQPPHIDPIDDLSEIVQSKKENIEWITVPNEPAASYLPSPAGVAVTASKTEPSFEDPIPKVDSWTLQFTKPSTTIQQTPIMKKTNMAPPKSSVRKRRGPVQLVDAPGPILTKQMTLTSDNPPPQPSKIISQLPIPEESPLTKAKRLDSEYLQREQKLRAYLSTASDDLKRKMDGLRSTTPVGSAPIYEQSKTVVIKDGKETAVVDAAANNPKEPALEPKLDLKKHQQQQQQLATTEKPSDILKALTQLDPEPVKMQPAKQPQATEDIFKETPPISLDHVSTIGTDLVSAEPLPLKNAVDEDHFAPKTTSNNNVVVLGAKSTLPVPVKDQQIVRLSSSSGGTLEPKHQQKQPIKPPPIIDHRAAVEEQRKRLQERQNKAIERRKQLQEKAQAAKLPKEPSFNVLKNSAPPSTSTSTSKKPSDIFTTAKPHGAVGLNAVTNTNTLQPSKQQQQQPSTPEAQKAYKMPLPKTKSPMAPKSVLDAKTPESLPEIKSEDDNPNTLKKKNMPAWARTPALMQSLTNQTVRPEDIFGEVQPIKLEDFFKGKKFNRSSTGWNQHHY